MKIAIMLDLDNLQPDLNALEHTLRTFGEVCLRRAFASDPKVRWYYGDELRRFGYRLELTPGESPKGQEVDHLLVETSLELHASYDAIALCSNDSDYIPLLARLRALGKHSIVLGHSQGKRLQQAADRGLAISSRPTARGPRARCPQGEFFRMLAPVLAAELPAWQSGSCELHELVNKVIRRMWDSHIPAGSPARLVTSLLSRYGLSRVRLSQLTGVSSSTISRWERGLSRPTPTNLRSLLHLHH